MIKQWLYGITRKHLLFSTYAPYWILLLISALLSWYPEILSEDLMHFNALSYDEAIKLAAQSYNNTNARLGELLLYILGVSTDGASSYFIIWIYRIFNPIIITACAILSYRIGTGHWPQEDKNSTIVSIIIILCILSNKTGYYWLCSNANWFYPSIIALIFFILVEPYFYGNFNLTYKRYFLAFVCVPFIGMSNENTSMISFLLYTGTGIYYIAHKKKYVLSKSYLIMGGALLIFVLLFYLSPGPYKRAGETNVTDSSYIIDNIISINWLHIIFWSWRLLVILTVLLVIYPRIFFDNIRARILGISIIMLGGILMPAPAFGAPRSLIPVEIGAYTLIASIVYNSVHKNKLHRKKIVIIIALQLLISLTILIPQIIRVNDYRLLYNYVQNRANYAKANGINTLVLTEEEIEPQGANIKLPLTRYIFEIYPLYTIGRPFVTTASLNNDFDHDYARFQYSYHDCTDCHDDGALNIGIARYFGLRSIIVLRKNALHERQTNSL